MNQLENAINAAWSLWATGVLETQAGIACYVKDDEFVFILTLEEEARIV